MPETPLVMSSTAPQILSATATPPHWEGDYWVDGTYQVLRKWVDKYPDLYGPAAQDPDEGNGEGELDDYISRILNKYTGAGGTFSTWSERHTFITAVSIGYLDVAASTDIPPVPKFWLTEGHYWLTGLVMGRAAKKVEQAAPGWKTYLTMFAAGGISVTGILKLIGINI